MTTGTRWMLSVLVVVVVYAVLMTAAVGSYEFLILLLLAVTGLVCIWRAQRGARK
jgi:hypothetical protein